MWILPNLSVTCHKYYVHLPYLQVVKLNGKLFSSTLEMECLMPSLLSRYSKLRLCIQKPVCKSNFIIRLLLVQVHGVAAFLLRG